MSFYLDYWWLKSAYVENRYTAIQNWFSRIAAITVVQVQIHDFLPSHISKKNFPLKFFRTRPKRLKKKALTCGRCWRAKWSTRSSLQFSSWWVHACTCCLLTFWGANSERLTSSRVSEMQHSSWEVSMCIKAFRITNCFLSLNLKGHILLKGSSTPSIVPQKISLRKILRFPPKRPGDESSSIAEVQKKTPIHTPCRVPLEDLRCRHHLPVILLIRCGGSKLARKRRFLRMKRRSLWDKGLLWFPSWCFCWNVFVGTKI